MSRFRTTSLIFLLFAFSASIAQAQTNFKFFGPLVPACGDKNICTACDIFKLLQNLINFGMSAAVIIAIVMLAYGGILMLFATASPGLLEKGKKIIKNSLFGVVIVLVSWLAIDTLIKILVGQEIVGSGAAQIKGIGRPWNEIECNSPAFPTVDNTKKNEDIIDGKTGADIEAWESTTGDEGMALKNPIGDAACANTSTYNDAINEASARYGVSPERIKAIISVESGGRTDAMSTDNDGGHSHGLMQMRLETARDLDSKASLVKLADPAYNIMKGTQYYSQLRQEFAPKATTVYSADDLASAAYNAGKKAIQPSANCSKERMFRFECEWDNNEHTLPNSRDGHPGYGVTREYIPKVNSVEQKFKTGQCT
ncbi:MAG: transglycosylase SLT domain-containing protein [Candidatus Sungbacteria bacterium]|nr:transglycosylase SLT domain-containing protein [Candidatus Sungbacteria bacterium]